MLGVKALDKVEYILGDDPALDRDSPDFDWDAYWRDGDRKHAPIKPGCVPTVYRLRRLSRRQYLDVAKKDDIERAAEAVAWGLAGADNLHRNGQPLTLKFTKATLGERLTEDSLDAIFAPSLVGEVGLRILTMCGPDPTTGQG